VRKQTERLKKEMASYRFCRTDDIGLLVDALNRCWSPYFPDEPPMTPAAFKRSIRDLQVWCSSCMVAFSGPDPIGVLIGAKRPSGTLVHRIAVHPDHRRQGHGRHLLTSLSSKLAILGPPRMIAEVPETLAAACGLFSACGYVQEAVLTDYVLERSALTLRQAQGHPEPSRGMSERGSATRLEGFVIPVTVDDLAANGLLGPPSPLASAGQEGPQVCWERSVETLTARKEDIAGLAVASDERIESYLLHMRSGEIATLRSVVDDGGAGLKQLVSRLRPADMRTARFPKVHPAEISRELLETLGFRPAGEHRLYATKARSQ
jgi:GNAT superfamily N-acetyltransferase